MSFRPHATTRLLLDVFWWNFMFGYFSNICRESYVYWTVHHLDSWIKRDQLDFTCIIISLFNAQHVSDVNTSILRSLRLICWVITWVVLLWFDVCWCYVVVWLGWCGIRMQAEACIRIPHQKVTFCSKTFFFFFKNRSAFEILWKNVIEPGRPQMTILRMGTAWWVSKATKTHSEYVILLLFHCNSVCTKAPERYVIILLAVLLYVIEMSCTKLPKVRSNVN